MRFFNFLARHISYTFAIAFHTILVSWVLSYFSYFLGSSFFIISYEKLAYFLIKWLPPSVLIPVILHYIEFGMLTPLGIPALIRPLRSVNIAYKNRLEIPADDLNKVYTDFSYLPMYNLIVATSNVVVAGILGTCFAVYEYNVKGNYSPMEILAVLKAILIMVVMFIIFYGISTYLITEALTNAERSQLYNKIVQTGARVKPRALIGIRIKFMFFLWMISFGLERR